ncbi:MAG: YggU family protein [Deltaproteobacteria bacterium]|nr:YggU family protein [Deltaproteobacteria bacterium]MBN2686718.1 YggU family protein [Deltaproteobacteria bacterium]
MTFSVKETTDGVVFKVRVLPRSSRCEIAGIQDDALKLKITAPPVEGQANEECIRFLSRALGVKRNRISITAGGKSKNKSIAITGLTRKDIESIIPT